MKLFATNPIDALTFTNAPPRTMLYILAAFMMTINEWEKKDYTDGFLVLIRHLESEVQRLEAENNQLKAENAELTKENDFLGAIAIRGGDKLEEK